MRPCCPRSTNATPLSAGGHNGHRITLGKNTSGFQSGIQRLDTRDRCECFGLYGIDDDHIYQRRQLFGWGARWSGVEDNRPAGLLHCCGGSDIGFIGNFILKNKNSLLGEDGGSIRDVPLSKLEIGSGYENRAVIAFRIEDRNAHAGGGPLNGPDIPVVDSMTFKIGEKRATGFIFGGCTDHRSQSAVFGGRHCLVAALPAALRIPCRASYRLAFTGTVRSLHDDVVIEAAEDDDGGSIRCLR